MIAPADITPEPKPEKSAQAPAAAPTVETTPTFKEGESVKHLNGQKYTVRYQTPEGVALEGVANLVNPNTLKSI